MNVKQRIEKAEKAVGITQEKDPPVIIVHLEFGSSDLIPHFPEPVEEWATVKRKLEESRRERLPCVVINDPFAEYEARHGLEAGTLSKHALRGKVPFEQLLATATGPAPSQPQ
jgi:hypothetical protein